MRRANRPLAIVACAFAGGIVVDSLGFIPQTVWLVALLISLALSLSFRRSTIAISFLLTGLFSAGGAWHHERLLVYDTDDIGFFASDDRRLARIRGTIDGDVVSIVPGEWEQKLSSTADVRCRFAIRVDSLEDGGDWIRAAGKAVIVVAGESPDWQTGDHVQVIGWLTKPAAPLNPGEFDYRTYLEQKHIRATLFTESSKAVTVLAPASFWNLDSLRQRLRQWASNRLHKRLGSEDARLADALLLGLRSSLLPDEEQPFLESGTIHVLVVSGLHVGLMAMFAWSILGFTGVSLRRRAALTILLIVFYTFLTGANPPAMRAAVLVSILLGEYLFVRRSEPINSLAASALVVMFVDPADLFRPGPQLSFLCAFAILAWFPLFRMHSLSRSASTFGRDLLRRSTFAIVNGAIISVLLWLTTAPLVACDFHLFSPVSIVASVVLIPLATLSLSVGVAFLTLSWLPGVASVLGWILGTLLSATASVSAWGASWESLSFYVAGPAGWWVAGWYLLLIAAWLLPIAVPLGRLHVALLLAWLGLGLGTMLLPRQDRDVEYSQLAVGHGNAGVLTTPDGRTVLFDAGSIVGPKVAERIIAPFLWHRGIGRIDAVVLSHPDIDHFNGLVSLLRRFPIDVVFMAPTFASSQEPAGLLILEELRRREVPVRFLRQGDRLDWGGVDIEVLHPPGSFTGATDNAESLVVSIEYGGSAILLTGDVEGGGLAELLRQPSSRSTVLVAPHHGSPGSNTPELANWADPELVISSQGFESPSPNRLKVYQDVGAAVVTTNVSGCVTIRWTETGIEVSTFADGRHFKIGGE